MKLCLLFHGLGPPPARVCDMEAPYWLPSETFRRVLEIARASPNRTEITFDDGNDSDVHIALPALLETGMTAAFFIPTDRIDQPGFVSTADIRGLRQAGMKIGSHGCAHIRWTEVSDEAIADDVMRSVERLENILGEPVRSVAIPYGDCDLRVLRVLRRLGIARVYSSFRGPNTGGPWLVRRDCIKAQIPATAIERLLTRKYGARDAALSLLRVCRRVGWAGLLPALA
jgi:peptidoglycan/xylan/chitin deacetylase (PgdA/CDA1 family)